MSARGEFSNAEAEKALERFNDADRSVHEATLTLIRGVVGRAKALRKPKLVPCSIDKTFYIDNKPYDIVLISVPIRIKKINGSIIPPNSKNRDDVFDLVQKEFDHFQICVRDAGDGNALKGIENWCNFIKEQCNFMIPSPKEGENGVKFVLLNELGFPNFWLGQLDQLKDTRLRNDLMLLHHDLHRRLQDIATERNVVIIGGSAHDVMTFQNWGPIFFPEKNRFCDHKKLTSAYKIGEYIKTSVGDEYPVYRLGSISFSVFVCFDAFDLNIFFEQFVNASATNKIVPDVVFVPSFYINEGEAEGRPHAMRSACRQLSQASNVIVVFCNQYFDQDNHEVFVGGKEIKKHEVGPATRITIDAEKLADIREEALPVWEEMKALFRKPSSVIRR